MFALQFNQLNRQGEIRHDFNAVQQLSQHNDARFIPICQQRYACIKQQPLWLTAEKALSSTQHIAFKHLIYLGSIGSVPYFALRFANTTHAIGLFDAIEWHGLRAGFSHLSDQDAYLINVATAMENWHKTHQFCGDCGAESFSNHGGFERHCSNPSCKKLHFPRTDSAIICAITHKDKLLLGRQASWEENRYSVIAGFVEPGESLEQAVTREAMEEVGLELSTINYFASQPWPFPQSLMVGFTAESSHASIDLKDKELEHASWFERDEIAELIESENLILPNQHSISRALIEQWRKI